MRLHPEGSRLILYKVSFSQFLCPSSLLAFLLVKKKKKKRAEDETRNRFIFIWILLKKSGCSGVQRTMKGVTKSMSQMSLDALLFSFQSSLACLTVLVLGRVELIFLLGAGAVLFLGFRVRMMLIRH